jgi:hypothetical protein
MNYRYRISWHIPDDPASTRLTNPGHQVRVNQFEREMLALRNDYSPGRDLSPRMAQVRAVIRTFAHLVTERIEEKIRVHGVLWADDLDVSLAVYDDRVSGEPPRLRVVAGTYMSVPEYWNLSLEVGDGNAGRAYKKNICRSFDAERARQDPRNQTYVTIPGGRAHQFLYSMPLRHPLNEDLIFGILNVGGFSPNAGNLLRVLSDDEGTKWLLDQSQEYVLTRLLEALNIQIV